MKSNHLLVDGSRQVDVLITEYHVEQARTRNRRAKARADAPKRAAARKSKVAGEFDRIAEIADTIERRNAQMEFDTKQQYQDRLTETALTERELVTRRMKVGFENTRSIEVGGRVRAPFVENGLRSDRLGRAGKMFVAGTRKAKHLRSSNEKGFITRQHMRKVLNLDYAWVEGNREMVSLIRVDLDRCFSSFDELRSLLGELVNTGRLACLPHLVAGDIAPVRISERGADGVWTDRHPLHLIRPHLWFVLPTAVNMGVKGREAPKRLLDGVYRALVHALLELGADPNAAALLVRGKSPLSPWWQAENFNDEIFPSLRDYAKAMPIGMRSSREVLCRMSAEAQSGLLKEISNAFYNAASAEAWRILHDLHSKGDKGYLDALGDRSNLRSLLVSLMPMDHVLTIGDGIVEPSRGAYVLDKVIGYAASRWDASKADSVAGHRNKGKLRHLTDSLKTVAEKQAVAGRASAGVKTQAARNAVLKGIENVIDAGKPFTQAEVVRASGLHRNTVSKHWRFCLSVCTRRCVDKKGGISPTVHKIDKEQKDQDMYDPFRRVTPSNRVSAQNPAVVEETKVHAPAQVAEAQTRSTTGNIPWEVLLDDRGTAVKATTVTKNGQDRSETVKEEEAAQKTTSGSIKRVLPPAFLFPGYKVPMKDELERRWSRGRIETAA